MIIFSVILVSGLFFYKLLAPPGEELAVPNDLTGKKKVKFRINGVNSNA